MPIERSSDPAGFTAFEHDGWEAVSEGYETYFLPVTRQTAAVTLDAAGIGEGTRVLDVCTGPGLLAGMALERGADVVGVDFSDEMVSRARRNVPKAEFHTGDAQALPFDAESFDAVVCGYGIIHVPDPAKALAEMRRVVRPGGRVAVSGWAQPEPGNGFGLVFGAIRRYADMEVPLPHGPDFFQFGTPDSMADALSSVGFDDVRSEQVEQTWSLDDPAAIVRAFLEGAVRARGLLLAQADDGRRAVEEAVIRDADRFAGPAGGFAIPMPAVVGSGAK